MTDLTDFKKYKIAYLLIILFFSLLTGFLTAPSCREAFVDISVEPPENVRKTDFSWITVNEWFATQTCLIKSGTILNGVKSDLSEENLEKVVSVNRLGAANIIRISVSTDKDIETAKKLAGDIANLYLIQLNNPDKAASEVVKTNKWVHGTGRNELLDNRLKIEEYLTAANKRSEDYEAKLKILEAKPDQLQPIKDRIAELDRALPSLKAELASFKSADTDNLPSVVKLRNQVGIWEKEKQRLEQGLSVAQKAEDERADITGKIEKDTNDIEILQDKIREIDNELSAQRKTEEGAVKKEDAPKGGITGNRIITPPTENTKKAVLGLGARLLAAGIIGVIFWVFVGMGLKNAYLYWVIKGRFFKR